MAYSAYLPIFTSKSVPQATVVILDPRSSLDRLLLIPTVAYIQHLLKNLCCSLQRLMKISTVGYSNDFESLL
jgi:hypothetical protein